MFKIRYSYLIALMAVLLIHAPVKAVDLDGFSVIKGTIVDVDGDGKWDGLTFTVETKSASFNVPVVRINLMNNNSIFSRNLFFTPLRINNRITEYYVDVSRFNISGSLNIEVTFDLSQLQLIEPTVQSASGPGTNPNETILIIDYP